MLSMVIRHVIAALALSALMILPSVQPVRADCGGVGAGTICPR